MSDEETNVVKDVIGDLKKAVEDVGEVPEPTRAILVTNLFLSIQKLRSLVEDE